MAESQSSIGFPSKQHYHRCPLGISNIVLGQHSLVEELSVGSGHRLCWSFTFSISIVFGASSQGYQASISNIQVAV